MDPAALLGRFLERPRVAYVRSVLDAYGAAAGGLLANGLAFAALFAVIPISLVTLGLAGSAIGDPRIQGILASAIIEVFPPLESLITEALAALASGAVATSLLGLAGLIWSASQFYVSLDVAFSRIFAGQEERDVFHRTARGFLWVAILLGAVVAFIVVGALTTAAATLIPGEFALGEAISAILVSPPALLLLFIGVVATAYRVLPPRTPRWSSIAPPALFVGLVVFALTQLFAFLAPRLVGIAALAGSLATAFVALAWLSFGFQALLYGAAWVRVRDDRARARPGGSALAGPAAPAEPGGGGE